MIVSRCSSTVSDCIIKNLFVAFVHPLGIRIVKRFVAVISLLITFDYKTDEYVMLASDSEYPHDNLLVF